MAKNACPIATVRDLTADAAELNKLDGASANVTAANLNTLTALTAKLQKVAIQNDVTAISSSAKACAPSGVNVVAGGTGLADATLAAPSPGSRCVIVIGTITSGTVVVTCAAGVTFDGTNNTATFNAAADELEMVYKSATEWQIINNVGSVALSSV